jgi:hypothetical protein
MIWSSMTNIHAPAPAAGSDLAAAIRRGLVVGSAVLAIVIPPAVGPGEVAATSSLSRTL